MRANLNFQGLEPRDLLLSRVARRHGRDIVTPPPPTRHYRLFTVTPPRLTAPSIRIAVVASSHRPSLLFAVARAAAPPRFWPAVSVPSSSPASPSSRLLPSRHLRELLHGTATVAAIVPVVNTASLSTDYGQDFVGKCYYEQAVRRSHGRASDCFTPTYIFSRSIRSSQRQQRFRRSSPFIHCHQISCSKGNI
ncbi:hypothetical protein AAHA92_21602 [Salvia divinorum]|uniref:Uncharacterized protein n=1 Tax=Salvia divinorum TaxID=28513 RepID=A0ABD1GKZ2_SALDI